jgi:hypothetical protein
MIWMEVGPASAMQSFIHVREAFSALGSPETYPAPSKKRPGCEADLEHSAARDLGAAVPSVEGWAGAGFAPQPGMMLPSTPRIPPAPLLPAEGVVEDACIALISPWLKIPTRSQKHRKLDSMLSRKTECMLGASKTKKNAYSVALWLPCALIHTMALEAASWRSFSSLSRSRRS